MNMIWVLFQNNYTVEVGLKIAAKIACAVDVLHSHGIAHLDLTTSCVIYHPSSHTIKLINFGCAKKNFTDDKNNNTNEVSNSCCFEGKKSRLEKSFGALSDFLDDWKCYEAILLNLLNYFSCPGKRFENDEQVENAGKPIESFSDVQQLDIFKFNDWNDSRQNQTVNHFFE